MRNVIYLTELVSEEFIWDNFAFQSLQEELDRMFPEVSISLNQMLEGILSGNVLGGLMEIMKAGVEGCLVYLGSVKTLFIWLLILGIASSVLTRFVEIFDKHQIAELSFFFLYLLFMTILLKCYQETVSTVMDLMENIMVFMKLMIPTYLLAVSIASGTAMVSVTHQGMILLIYIVEYVLQKGVVPLAQVYMYFTMMNGIWVEEKLGLMIGIVKKAIDNVLKISIGVVTGVSVMQSLIHPAVQSVRTSLIQKIVSAIPGIGNIAEGTLELVVGASMIIKNSVGILCMLVLLALCAAPLFYIYVLSWVLRITAAVLGLVSDKRLTAYTNHSGEACMILFRTASTAVLLFLISISLIALTTGRMV